MTRSSESVTREIEVLSSDSRPHSSELPEPLIESALLRESLDSEWIETFSTSCVVNRKSGFQIPTLLLVFFAFFTTGHTSLKACTNYLRRRSCSLLASFAGLERFPTQSSVSRFLERVSLPSLEGIMTWLLISSHATARELLRHSICETRDTFHEGWHLFDLDPSVTPLRQRHLVDDPSHPPAQRDTDNFAAPGYPGRKRGDVIVRRTIVQHVASSLWLGSWLRTGGGDSRETFQAAVDSIGECCEFADLDVSRAILRVDGEGGGVPYITMYQSADLRYIVRCIHYGLLDRIDLNALATSGNWFEVSGDGTQREAIDLGIQTLSPGATTVTVNGDEYEPVESRVILTRTQSSTSRGAGQARGDYVYELFATDLPPSEWPAPEIIKGYFHRSSIENRLAQEDRELGLDKIFSYELGGQSFAVAIGLLVWNLRLYRGFELARSELDREFLPQPHPRDVRPVSAPEPSADGDWEEPCSSSISPSDVETVSSQNTAEVPTPEDMDELPTPDKVDEGATPEKADELPTPEEVEQAIRNAIGSVVDPSALLETMSWDREKGMFCASDSELLLTHTREVRGQPYIGLMAPAGVCGDCVFRTSCSRATNSSFRKILSVPVPDREVFDELLDLRKRSTIAAAKAVPATPLPRPTPTHVNADASEVPHTITYEPPSGGPYDIALAMLNPRELVHRFAEAVQDITISVRRSSQPKHRPPPRYFYPNANVRRRRRHTWAERLAYNKESVPPTITAYCGPAATGLLGAA